MTAHSSILAWEIPRTEEPGGLIDHGVARVRDNLGTKPQPCVYLSILSFYFPLDWPLI